MPPEIVVSEEAVASATCDVLVVPAHAGQNGTMLAEGAREVDAALDGYLSEYLQDANFKAKVGDVAIVPTLGRLPAKTIAVVGLGDEKEVNASTLRRAAGAAARRLSEHRVVASTLHRAAAGEDGASAAAEGFLLGSYRFTTYKSDPHPSKVERVVFLGAAQEAAVEKAVAGAEATTLARDLVNEPASSLTPDALARRTQEIADVSGLECTVFDEDELSEKGFNGVLTVARGSERAPRFIKLRYAPDGAKGKVALVGKGVTFDSGGLSLKDAKNMETMKTDMAGAAAVIAAMSALRRLGAGIEVLGFVPATENMPGADAVKPGDVIRHYGGKTTEVLNTDAEGRLILADAIAFAREHQPDAIVDMATLTGTIIAALGRKATGLFSNDETLATEIEAASEVAGERVWRMPLYDDYKKELESEVADQKNIGGRWGGAILAALFLTPFVGDVPWAHLDIAGTARSESDYEEISKGGTGVPVRTLISWIERRAR